MTGRPDGPRTVAVWLLWIPDHSAAAADSAWMLDDGESARADGFQDPAARERYVTSHVGLRVLLGGCLGIAPQDVEFLREPCGMPDCEAPHGRPVIAGRPQPCFSLSHAGDAALFALADTPVGVDIESAELMRDSLDGAARRLHIEERRAVAALSPALRERAVLGCWVRKEAYLKGIGTGLPGGLGRHHVGLAEELAPDWAPPGPEGWAIADVPAPEGYQAAVAVRHDNAGADGPRPLVRVSTLRLP
ncbi:4'-phosphopantetheinyl transferase family protein [Streptomyces ipomoeae]|uniref:4'-phosphopantetheinyl transferase family protein n=1 Tax=Streptomyces ipomoeae TaxID=103232 RepID=UPI00114798D3|nr:4'-phosphopantetheinyl transferase superfamily protein [Streptomyces ipomoeae]MDX2933540.1 4'-phosphopantetheinyl transferase superfamily protein [Streptomyces ipomoeae]TQE22244.1 4'-phosphopantetheinyl transferase superfamily protein [Streptomyces ipomoeae]